MLKTKDQKKLDDELLNHFPRGIFLHSAQSGIKNDITN